MDERKGVDTALAAFRELLDVIDGGAKGRLTDRAHRAIDTVRRTRQEKIVLEGTVGRLSRKIAELTEGTHD